MNVFTALTRTTPALAGVKFEAVVESTLTASVETTGYPLESGVDVVDHALIVPMEYTMTILASNNPLQPGVTDFIGGAVSNFVPDALAGIAGMSAGLLSSSKETHGSAVLKSLINNMVTRQPITVTDGDITLNDMLITNITRTRTVENEDGLEAEITLQELPLIERVQQDQLSKNLTVGDPSEARAGGFIAQGQAKIADAGEKIRKGAQNVFDRVTDVFSGDEADATGVSARGFS